MPSPPKPFTCFGPKSQVRRRGEEDPITGTIKPTWKVSKLHLKFGLTPKQVRTPRCHRVHHKRPAEISSNSCTPRRQHSMWGLLNSQHLGISMESGLTVYRNPCGRGNSTISDAKRRRAAWCLKTIPIPDKFDRQGRSCKCYVGSGPIKHIISREVAPMIYLLHKVNYLVYVVILTCCCVSPLPPWFTCQTDCGMLHQVIPAF